jgi:hypothetical protein
MIHICPTCWGTRFSDLLVKEDAGRVLTRRLHVCVGCGSVFVSLDLATETAIRLQKEKATEERERSEEVRLAIEEALWQEKHPR